MAMMAYDERRILEMLREDELSRRRAFESIVNNFSEQLYWQIRHMVLSHEDANDILQNTFIKAWTNIDSFMGYSRISTWLYRIAVNETLTFLNRQRTTVPLETDEEGELSIRILTVTLLSDSFRRPLPLFLTNSVLFLT